VLALRQAGSEVRLVLAGQLAGEFERFYGRLPPSAQQIIQPLGIVNETDKHTLLSQAEMLLLPSRTDSFGIVLLEAWAHGKPVIGARAGGIPGVIDHQHNGLLVKFGDVAALGQAIQSLLTDVAKGQTMGANGRDKVHTQYNWQQVAERVWANYEAVWRSNQ
jgi:glycosyltransferase involved in cell wall biosynthesis